MHPHGRLRVRRVTRPVPFAILAAMHASASAGEEDKVPDIFACADPWQWWPGETPALGLHAHMAYASVRTRRMGFGAFGDFRFPWDGS